MAKTYEIPAENFAKLELKINALARRAVKLDLPEPVLEVVGERMVKTLDIAGLPTGKFRKVFDVVVSGDNPQLEGWTLVAIIEHLPDGNLIKNIPPTGLIPGPILERYRTIEPICEHCKLERSRKLTFLILKDSGENIIVGSDCLKDFTGHKNPEALAKWYSVLEDTLEEAEHEDFGGGGPSNYLSLAGYLDVVSAIIEKYGWVSRGEADIRNQRSSADLALDPYVEISVDEDNIAEAGLVASWVRNQLSVQEDLSDYEHSLVVIFGTEESTGSHFHIKHAGYVASAINAYQRHLLDKSLADNATSEYQGEIGERLDLVLTVKKRLEYEGFNYLDTLHITIMEDEDGNVYVWKTSAKKLGEGETYKVRGTVKAHNDYKGINQTILTRCAISCPECGSKIKVFYSEWAGGSLEACEKCYNEQIEKNRAALKEAE